MNIAQHPDLVWLVDYSAGTLTRGFGAVIGGHLEVCAECRAQLRLADHLGTRLVNDAPGLVPRLQPATIRAAAAASGAYASRPRAAPEKQTNLRGYVAAALGFDWQALDWRSGTAGLRIARLQDRDDERIWLLHGDAGAAMPKHTHGGAELTLILHGAYRTKDQRYGVGDVDENDEAITHQPVVTADSDCVSLLVFEGRLKYTGTLGLAQRVLKF